jgi:hypothetical protein
VDGRRGARQRGGSTVRGIMSMESTVNLLEGEVGRGGGVRTVAQGACNVVGYPLTTIIIYLPHIGDGE